MTERTDWLSILTWRLATLVAAAMLMAPLAGTASAWLSAHGDRDNSGFVNVTTAPAGKGGTQSVPGLGTFRPGAGPVVASDGTVYLGTTQGKLFALRPDGSQLWSREITRGQAIVASPAIGSDGSVYVIGVQRFRDNRVDPPKESVVSTLHRFNSTGAWLNQIAFPDHGGIGPEAFGPPNIWRSGGSEAIMVPTIYRNNAGGHALRLIAFSPDGQVLDDARVIGIAPRVLGGSALQLGHQFTPPAPPEMLVKVPPMPGIGIFSFAGGGTPIIVVSDHYKDLVGYTFAGQRFSELFRVHQDDALMRTPPMILPGGHTLMAVETLRKGFLDMESGQGSGRLIFARPNVEQLQPIKLVYAVLAAPTRMADGRVALVDGLGNVLIMQNGRLVNATQAPGRSIASAAASRTHFFVSAEDGFVTYDTNTLAEVSRVDWIGGGLHPPVIGPQGHVYAIASNILFVFPPPKLKATKVTTVGQPVDVAEPATTASSAKTYNPPLTASGNRLFACEELDEDDCGKGDHSEISLAWCQKQGYAKVQDYDVGKLKVKAETLDGQFCSKKTCRVFDSIGCEM